VGIGTLHAAHECGIAVPDDLAVVGIDNTSLADVCHPGLTSVDLGSARRGRKAAQLLLARMDDPSLEPRSVRVPPMLTERRSTTLQPASAPPRTVASVPRAETAGADVRRAGKRRAR